MKHSMPLALALALVAACASATPPMPAPLATAATATASAAAPEASDPAAELAARLSYLARQLEDKRVAQHIPGLAVAIVRGDEVVFARGFGVRDLETNEPVTEHTIFSIGSSTKAFTATLLAMLVDERKLAWDDPVTKHLPELTLRADAPAGETVTVRDLLTHRTGFPRMSLLWASGELSRAEVFAYASKASPTKPLRETWQYNNVQYMAAGELGARLAGSSWAELIRARVFTPLGMTTSHATWAAADADPRRAKGYTWWASPGRNEPENHRDLDVIGPAGGIYSNAVEMTRWLRFLIGGGVFAGSRLVSEAALAETQKPQMEVGPGIGYGFGWMVRELDGHRLVEHGGNIDGYAAAVGLFPDDRVGYALLTNASVNALQGEMPGLVYAAMIGEGYRETGAEQDLSRYEGRYEADFGPFAGKLLIVAAKAGTLTLDVPGQTVYELNPPDADGKWVFKVTDTIAVSFEGDADEPAVAMRLHQGGFDFELPREGSPIPLVVDADEVAGLVGRYRSADDPDQVIEVALYRGRLTLLPSDPIKLQLDQPDDQGHWKLRARPSSYASFELADGAAVALEIADDGKTRRFARLAADAKAEPVTLAAVLGLRKVASRKRALVRAGLVVARGTSSVPQSGLSGGLTMYLDGTDCYRVEVDYGKAGATTSVVTKDGAWESGDFDQPVQLDGARLAQARLGNPRALHGDWSDYFDDIKLVGTEQRDGRLRYLVQLTAGELPAVLASVDATTGDVVAYRTAVVSPIGELPVAVRFEDFRSVAGVRLPFRMITEEFQSGETTVQLETARPRQRQNDALFPPVLPAP